MVSVRDAVRNSPQAVHEFMSAGSFSSIPFCLPRNEDKLLGQIYGETFVVWSSMWRENGSRAWTIILAPKFLRSILSPVFCSSRTPAFISKHTFLLSLPQFLISLALGVSEVYRAEMYQSLFSILHEHWKNVTRVENSTSSSRKKVHVLLHRLKYWRVVVVLAKKFNTFSSCTFIDLPYILYFVVH